MNITIPLAEYKFLVEKTTRQEIKLEQKEQRIEDLEATIEYFRSVVSGTEVLSHD